MRDYLLDLAASARSIAEASHKPSTSPAEGEKKEANISTPTESKARTEPPRAKSSGKKKK